MTRARSLSRLANSTVFTVSDTNRVGIGSTIPDVKLDVGGKAIIDDTTQSTSITTGSLVVSGGVGIAKSLFIGGDMSVAGTLTYEDVTNTETAGITTTGGLVVTGLGATFGSISTHFSNIEFGAAGVGGTITPLGHAEFAGVVTATSFSGDGSALTGVASTENINTSTLAQFTGGVGIADSIFHIGDDDTAIRFPAANTFTVETKGNEVVRVNSHGRVGIMTDPPSDMDGRVYIGLDGAVANTVSQVDVSDWGKNGYINLGNRNGSTTGSETLLLSANAGDGGVASGIGFGRENSTNWGTYISFKTHSTSTSNLDELYERLRITSAGKIGINDASPERAVDIRADNVMVQLEGTGGNGRQYSLCSTDDTTGASVGPAGQFVIYDDTSGANRLNIDSSGRVGINSDVGSGSEFLQVDGSGADTAFIKLKRTNPAGNDSAYGGMTVIDNNGVRIGRAEFRNQDGTTRSQFVISTYTSSSLGVRLRVRGDGNVLPGADNAQDLGSSSLRWANIYSADLQLSNEGSSNDVDGTWGQYTIKRVRMISSC